MLAELHHTLTKRRAGDPGGTAIQPLFDETLRAEYTNRNAVSRMMEGEAEPGDEESGSK